MATTQTDIYEGDIGTVFRVTILDNGVALPIADATVKSLRFKQPDGTIVTKDATFSIDGTDGRIQYIAEDGFLSQVGVWEIRGVITTPAGHWTSTKGSFTVKEID